MSKEDTLALVKNFPVAQASLSLWVFKRRTIGGFSARSVNTTPQLTAQLRQIVTASVARFEEVDEYELLAQVNEISCLHLQEDETVFGDLQALVDLPPEENLIRNIRHIDNSIGYIVRLRMDGQVIYCVKKVSDVWRAKKASSFFNVVVTGANELDLVDDRALTIAKNFDFFVTGGGILIANKASFETLLSFKHTYQNSFDALQKNAQFSGLFVDVAPLVAHVGTNAMHLRRMAVIEQRRHYADAAYIGRLRAVNAQKNWGIEFDAQGRIIATDASLKTIMQVLLNHRLYSELSLGTFDVPSAAQVA
ncbi:Kiwa anti-phage protein KwaB-like domain-containing protein [Variovorax sp. dw_308]|uniref:Kiwa anti-phage protein KwaB-like domain-containing protein n=1 Tax=Variovorax sp. dw_308 TaxID=2721546 RepID=UPI001C46A4C8|nr:Kiwa anti-phage protein KwaB-like domain-containing protein [Variovorax sp. dw_308]